MILFGFLLSHYNYAEQNKARNIDGWISRLIGEILMNFKENTLKSSEHWIRRAIDLDIKHGLMWQLAMDYTVYADLFIKINNTIKAKEMLSKAINIFSKCGADGWLKKYQRRLNLFQ